MRLIEKVFKDNSQLALELKRKIEELSKKIKAKFGEEKKIKIMNFCGTHEWSIVRYGIRALMPKNVELIAGPGCPVCVTPSYYIEEAIKLALEGYKIYTYGDTYRLMAVKNISGVKSLSEVKSLGGDVQVVTSILDASKYANSDSKESIFLGIGFETVAPGYAIAISSNLIPKKMSIMSLLKLTPPAMLYTIKGLTEEEKSVFGIIAPGHVSSVIGANSWKFLSNDYNIPTVISGFEPIDILVSIMEILKQIVRKRAETVIEYKRAVNWEGNKFAKNLINEVFYPSDDAWRGIGILPKSGLRIREKFEDYDSFKKLGIREIDPLNWKDEKLPGCRCSEVIIGKIKPIECPLFMKKCTPENPYGPCMVSMEGTCYIWARFGTIENFEVE
ncbi:hydrogenase formation protein HypD [Fervidicoccus fontis]|uniref:Hydrogenase formation HypD protein n=3 Tax=Fervidicoccus fontis TaxID=683846 RepID=I0A1Z6_FERFK|nr:hydrogenase formation HypD protein [Fervidicoccus fontis Kam940]MBE9391443.1 hydrogenase formation protein HypD [Fervidicoccus fontis]PMB78259.1 MAG: hydrogenase formation protein HypD [Fervidicoccus fontis]HEW63749.1 hydrogenase formation protein HypD [Fervidicoccus fontis]